MLQMKQADIPNEIPTGKKCVRILHGSLLVTVDWHLHS